MTDSSERQSTIMKSSAGGELYLDALNPKRKKKTHRARGCRGGANRRRGKYNQGKSTTRPLVEKDNSTSISSESQYQHSLPQKTFKEDNKRRSTRNSPPPLIRSWSLLSSASSSSCNSHVSFDGNNDDERLAPVTSGLTNMPEEAAGNPRNIMPILPSRTPLGHSGDIEKKETHPHKNFSLPPIPNSSLNTVSQGLGTVFFGVNQKYDPTHPYLDRQLPPGKQLAGNVFHNATLGVVDSNTTSIASKVPAACDNAGDVTKQHEINPKNGSFFITSPRSFLLGKNLVSDTGK